MMSLTNQVLILLGATTISYVADISTINYECSERPISTQIIHFFHHFINMYGLFGWLFTNKILLGLYVFVPILIVIYQRFNKNKCGITEYINAQCGITNGDVLRDLFYFLKIKSASKRGKVFTSYNLYLLITWLIGVYKLAVI
jgi:hypothetical protein